MTTVVYVVCHWLKHRYVMHDCNWPFYGDTTTIHWERIIFNKCCQTIGHPYAKKNTDFDLYLILCRKLTQNGSIITFSIVNIYIELKILFLDSISLLNSSFVLFVLFTEQNDTRHIEGERWDSYKAQVKLVRNTTIEHCWTSQPRSLEMAFIPRSFTHQKDLSWTSRNSQEMVYLVSCHQLYLTRGKSF